MNVIDGLPAYSLAIDQFNVDNTYFTHYMLWDLDY